MSPAHIKKFLNDIGASEFGNKLENDKIGELIIRYSYDALFYDGSFLVYNNIKHGYADWPNKEDEDVSLNDILSEYIESIINSNSEFKMLLDEGCFLDLMDAPQQITGNYGDIEITGLTLIIIA